MFLSVTNKTHEGTIRTHAQLKDRLTHPHTYSLSFSPQRHHRRETEGIEVIVKRSQIGEQKRKKEAGQGLCIAAPALSQKILILFWRETHFHRRTLTINNIPRTTKTRAALSGRRQPSQVPVRGVPFCRVPSFGCLFR